MKGTSVALVIAVAGLVAPRSVSAQAPLATGRSGVTLEVGAFTYERERSAGEGGVRLNLALGWRGLREPWFVEPNLRALARLSSRTEDSCGIWPCEDSGVDPLPEFWPGVTAGASFGDARFSQSLGLRMAFGVGDRLHPLLGLRYEGSARRAGWFLEGSIDRVESWQPGVSFGFRLWFRRTGVPRPTVVHPDLGGGDAGIFPPEPPATPQDDDEAAAPREPDRRD